jgi:predicted dehydrogenase
VDREKKNGLRFRIYRTERSVIVAYQAGLARPAARHRSKGYRYAASSLQELVSHPEVDLVLVLTPAFQHEEGIRAAIEAGKDVYCEWLLTPSTALCKELLELGDKVGVRTIVGLQRRLNPGYVMCVICWSEARLAKYARRACT